MRNVNPTEMAVNAPCDGEIRQAAAMAKVCNEH
jgi:hypothetical protein